MAPETKSIQVMAGPGGRRDPGSVYRTIEAKVYRDWASHQHLDVPGLWVLTCLPIGLNLPPDWCSFPTEEQAVAAMIDIQAISNSWHYASQQHFSNPAIGRQLRDIAKRHGAVEGPIGAVGRVDHDMLDRRLPGRPNGYEALTEA